ncbi:hypothetical protein BGZ58_000150 [Dissophora ornata]|nr:hypothetical protein BGZ58_000150 [Dissophora ornata]
MFNIFAVPPPDNPSRSSSSSCPRRHRHSANFNDAKRQQEQSKQSKQQQQELKQTTAQSSRLRNYSVLQTLQNSLFFGGLRSLSREIEAMDRQLAVDALARSSMKAKSLEQQQQQQQLEDSVATMASSTPTVFHLDAYTPVKRYKITVEEVPDHVLTYEAVDGNTFKDSAVVATTTAVASPLSVLNWLLYATTGTKDDDAMGRHIVQGHMDSDSRLVFQNSLQESSDSSADKGGLAAPPPPPMAASQSRVDTENSSSVVTPVAVGATATATAATAATMVAATASKNKRNKYPEAAPVKVNEAPMLVNKVKGEEMHSNQDTESEDMRPWWQRRRSREDHHVREQKHSSSSAGAATAAAAAAETTEGRGERVQRSWPPRRRSPSQTFTKTTITRPDGTVESKSVTLDRTTGVAETHTRVRHPDGSVQESVIRESKAALSHPVLVHAPPPPPPQQQQQPEPTDKAEHESLRSKFRERVVQRRQERTERREERAERHKERHERRKELRDAEVEQREATAAAYGFVHAAGPDDTYAAAAAAAANREGGNDARDNNKARQEPAAAAARVVKMQDEDPHRARIDFHRYHDQNYRNAWNQRREGRQRGNGRVRQREGQGEEEEEEEGEQRTKMRSWPPKGYLRRLEQEQEQEQDWELRHNV